MSTIVQKLALPKSDQEPESVVRVIENEKSKTVVQMRQQLIFMIITREKDDSYLFLTNIIDHLNMQIISLITNMMNKMLSNRPNFDPRTMMGGTVNPLSISIKNAIKSPGVFLHSFMSHPLSSSTRAQVNTILKEHNHPDNIFSMLLSPFGLFSMVKQKKKEIYPNDILLLMNLIHSSQALRTSESWIPVCLPGISPDGFVYAYIYFFTKNIGIVMITDVTTSDMFFSLKQKSLAIFEELTKLLDTLNNCLLNLPYSEDIPNIKNIRHFMIKSIEGSQYTMPRFLPYGEQSKEGKKYVKIFCELYEKYLELPGAKKKDFFYIEQKQEAYYCIVSNSEFIIFLDYNQFENRDKLHLAIKDLFKWIKAEENNYFIK